MLLKEGHGLGLGTRRIRSIYYQTKKSTHVALHLYIFFFLFLSVFFLLLLCNGYTLIMTNEGGTLPLFSLSSLSLYLSLSLFNGIALTLFQSLIRALCFSAPPSSSSGFQWSVASIAGIAAGAGAVVLLITGACVVYFR